MRSQRLKAVWGCESTPIGYGVKSNKAAQGKLQIFVPEVDKKMQPDFSPFRYPAYADDWGVEQDFLRFLRTSHHLVTRDFEAANFVYIPIFWTRYHLHNNFGKNGLGPLGQEVQKILDLGKPTFTVCQYDDGPLIELPDTKIFLSSRTLNHGLDAPLLASPLPAPFARGPLSRTYAANFVGRPDTHPIRKELIEKIKNFKDIYVGVKNVSAKRFATILSRSTITLAPRGYGGSSFRFYEAIKAGSVPWLIGDIDTRPFKSLLDWDSCSFYSRTVEHFVEQFERLDYQLIVEKRNNLESQIKPRLVFGGWNTLLIEELNSLRD